MWGENMYKTKFTIILLVLILILSGKNIHALNANNLKVGDRVRGDHIENVEKKSYKIRINDDIIDYKVYFETRMGDYIEFTDKGIYVNKGDGYTEIIVKIDADESNTQNYWALVSTEDNLYSHKFTFGDSQTTATLKENSENIKIEIVDTTIKGKLNLNAIDYVYKKPDYRGGYVVTLPKIGDNTKIMAGEYNIFASCIKDKKAYVLQTISNISKKNSKVEFDTRKLCELKIEGCEKNHLEIEALSLYYNNDILEREDGYQINRAKQDFDIIFVQKDTIISGNIKIKSKNNFKYVYNLIYGADYNYNEKENVKYMKINTNIGFRKPIIKKMSLLGCNIRISVTDYYGNELDMIFDENNKEIKLSNQLYDDKNNSLKDSLVGTKDKRYSGDFGGIKDQKLLNIEMKFDREELPFLKRMIHVDENTEYITDIESVTVNGKDVFKYGGKTKDSYIYTDIQLQGATIDIKVQNPKAKSTVEIKDITYGGSKTKQAVITITSENGKVTNKYYIIQGV